MQSINLARALRPNERQGAFTLVEVLVSTALVVVIMALLISSVDATQKVWSRSRSKISQFQAARTAFEAMTRQLSQATLNTYYDVEFRNNPIGGGLTSTDPVNFFRQSELHFVSGKTHQDKLLKGAQEIYPTQSVFFQTPVGHTSPYTRQLSNSPSNSLTMNRDGTGLLTAIGYFLKWGADEDLPKFLLDQPNRPKINRFRLWQVQQPTEGLGLFYNILEHPAPPTQLRKTTDWVKVAVDPTFYPTFSNTPPRVFAENIVALILIPKKAEKDRPAPNVLDLAPNYEYDSRPPKADGTPMKKADITVLGVNSPERKQFNQLPPILQVTMVAIDEAAAVKLEEIYGEDPPPLTKDLFGTISNEADFLKDLGTGIDHDLNEDSLVKRMRDGIEADRPLRLNYRIYTMDVVLRGSKWSSDS